MRFCELPADLIHSVLSAPRVLPDVLVNFVPYALVLAAFGAFVVWNGGIVLGMCIEFSATGSTLTQQFVGDKANHVPALHVPQLYYFVGFATAFGWPALVSGRGGILALGRDIYARMFGNRRYLRLTSVLRSDESNQPAETQPSPA